MRLRDSYQQHGGGVAMAAECHSRSGFVFQRKLSVDFQGGEITGEAGLVLVREFDERLGLTRSCASSCATIATGATSPMTCSVCFGSGSTRSWPDTRTPTTRPTFATTQRCEPCAAGGESTGLSADSVAVFLQVFDRVAAIDGPS